MIDLFGGESAPKPAGKQDPFHILRDLSGACHDCRLGQTVDRTNTGIVYAGPVTAEIAILGDTLVLEGVAGVKRAPLAGPALYVLRDWLGQLRQMSQEKGCRVIGEEDLFVINVVQCKTQRNKKEPFRLPNRDEVQMCFPRRSLRVLQSLPRLRVVITLGMLAGSAVLGWDPEPTAKSHEGAWFGSDYLPGVAIFPLNHPREYDREVEARKVGKLEQCLRFFHGEYLQGARPKILDVLAVRQQQRERILADQ